MRTLVLFLLLAGLRVCAQGPLGVSSLSNFPDTVTIGDSATFTAWIKNYGPFQFTGKAYVNSGVEDSSGIQSTGFDSIMISNLIVNDSIAITLKEVFTQTNYRLGTNVVVIWPITSGTPAYDTLKVNLIVQDRVAIYEERQIKLKLYPNPASDMIWLDYKDQCVTVNIYQTSGRLVQCSESKGYIDVRDLPKGAYLIEVILPNGRKSSGSFLKM